MIHNFSLLLWSEIERERRASEKKRKKDVLLLHEIK
jgi:hypothetical protein